MDGLDFVFNKQITVEVHSKICFFDSQFVCRLIFGQMKFQIKSL